jgi:hypothetical protein
LEITGKVSFYLHLGLGCLTCVYGPSNCPNSEAILWGNKQQRVIVAESSMSLAGATLVFPPQSEASNWADWLKSSLEEARVNQLHKDYLVIVKRILRAKIGLINTRLVCKEIARCLFFSFLF